ncbi:hypothetical protein KEJ32_05685, partial [Candidatus Bathyarchaeota archaeon]|nr:hypothetical protein [Candidatus Bathyarchaeota archaeon]
MKRLNCLIISFIFAGSLLSGIWLIGLSVSDEGVTLFFEPETVNVEPSQVFTVNVWVANVKNLYKWTLSLRWDAKVIELEPISSSAVTEGSFLKNVGRTRLTVLPYTAGSGYLSSISCELTQPISASGSGVLFSIRFKAKTNGDTPIAIESSVLYNYYKQIIPHSYKNGYVSVTSVIHDVAISLEGPATCVLGETNLLNVTIANLGQVDERNVLLKILINSKVWQEKTLTLLQRGTAEKLSFLWKPGNAGAFNITAYIVPHPYESNTANNQISLMVNVVELVHDVAIWLKVPNRIVLGENVMLNATIINVGGYDEANIDVLILINGEIVKSETINFLNVGSQRILTLQWQPAEDGIYNITGYVKPVANEFNVVNNLKSLFVKVSHTTQPKILIVSSDKGSYFVRGTSLPEFQFAVESAGYSYDIWIKSVNGRPTLERLLDYDVVIWTCGDFSSKALDNGDAEILERYLNAGGNIIIEGENVCENNPDSYSNLWRSVIHVTGYLGPNNAPGLTVIDTKHLIVQGLPTNLNWTIKPRSPDSVKASYGAYAILKYTNYEYAAAVVFDGGLVGIGSVVYFSFP